MTSPRDESPLTTEWSSRADAVLPSNSSVTPNRSSLPHTPVHTEESLVALLRGKSQEAFSYLYKAYGDVLYGVVSKVIPDEGIAEDALQEAFVKIWMHIDQYDAAKGRIYTWMLNIARNTAIDKLRSKGEIMRGKIRGDEESVNTTNAAFTTATQQSTDTIGVRQAVADLEPRYAQIVQLAYFQGYTLDEISKVLTVPLGTVKTRMRHALQSLRKHFSR